METPEVRPTQKDLAVLAGHVYGAVKAATKSSHTSAADIGKAIANVLEDRVARIYKNPKLSRKTRTRKNKKWWEAFTEQVVKEIMGED